MGLVSSGVADAQLANGSSQNEPHIKEGGGLMRRMRAVDSCDWAAQPVSANVFSSHDVTTTDHVLLDVSVQELSNYSEPAAHIPI
jgi:hypothetical protein